MRCRALVLALWGVLAGCATSVRVEPEGYRCDPGEVCPTGYACVQGVCTKAAEACATVQCTAKAAECVDATARTYVARCVNGACVSESVDTVCAGGCLGGACIDACRQVTCTAPPAATCADARTLRTFASTGTCLAASGACSYPSTDVSCPDGCLNGECQGANLCANVTCSTPPAATCVGQSARTYSGPGSCEPGTGQCSYQSTDTPCASGCFGGVCVTPLIWSQVGPRVRFAINSLDFAPLGGMALAVGNQGRVARWDGSDWTELRTPSTANDLTRVHFVAPGVAYIAGKNRTLWAARASGFSPVSLSGSGSGGNLVALYGRGENNVLVVDSTGNYWKYGGTSWASGSLPALSGPYTVRAAYIDETGRERVVGLCGTLGLTRSACVAYRNGNTWYVHTDASDLSFDAVGGSFSPPTTTTSEALVGNSTDALATHLQNGVISDLVLPTDAQGAGIVGISADGALANRRVYLLTSSASSNVGHLYQLEKSSTGLSLRSVLETYLGAESLSANVAPGSTGGVLVAETNRVANSNNIFRHSATVDEALDLGEDFVGASVNPAGDLVVATAFGDVGVRRSGATSWAFYRSPPVTLRALEARHGADVLLAGEGYNTSDGVLVKWSPQGGFARLVTRANTVFTSVCRVSDAEGWAVGTGGVIYSVTASGATPVTSPTTKDLLSVDCVAGQAVACGAEGTVLRATNGAWAAVLPTFPVVRPLTQCRLASGALWVMGDGVFQKLDGTTWTQLPALTGASGLFVRGPGDIYATVTTAPATSTRPGASAVHRFDGSQWVLSLAVTGVLAGGSLPSSRVLFGGTGGLLVEGR